MAKVYEYTHNNITVILSGNGKPVIHKQEGDESDFIIDAYHLKKRNPNVPCMYTISNNIVILELCYNSVGKLHNEMGPAKLIRYTNDDGQYTYEWKAYYYIDGKYIMSEIGNDEMVTYSEYLFRMKNKYNEPSLNMATHSPEKLKNPKFKCISRTNIS